MGCTSAWLFLPLMGNCYVCHNMPICLDRCLIVLFTYMALLYHDFNVDFRQCMCSHLWHLKLNCTFCCIVLSHTLCRAQLFPRHLCILNIQFDTPTLKDAIIFCHSLLRGVGSCNLLLQASSAASWAFNFIHNAGLPCNMVPYAVVVESRGEWAIIQEKSKVEGIRMREIRIGRN